MRLISFSSYVNKIIHNIETLELPYSSTYKLLKDKEAMKMQEKMISQVNVQHEKKLFNIYSIESHSNTMKNEKDGDVIKQTTYTLTLWIRIINPRFKCRRFIYPGDYIAELKFNPYGGWELAFHQDGCDRHGEHCLRPAEHPHIQAGKGCFGGHKTAIDNALWSANFYGACKLIRKYIEEYNGRDVYTRGKYFDAREDELTVDPEAYYYIIDDLNEEEIKKFKSFKPITFKTYRVKRKFHNIMNERYRVSCFRTSKDIYNAFAFWNLISPDEDGGATMPIEQTLEILEKFKVANPYSSWDDRRENSQYNPLWMKFNTKEALRADLEKVIPDFMKMKELAYKMLYNNGSFYLNMRFRLDPKELKKLSPHYNWIQSNVTGNNDSSPPMAAIKWLIRNPDVFILRAEESIHDTSYSFDLTKEVEETIPSSSTLLDEAVERFNSMKEELESLKLIVNKEKLAYLERERRKVLNEINNNTAKPETHQLSLGSL